MNGRIWGELRKFVVPEYVFGLGARNLASRYVRNLGGRRAMIVSDPGVVAAGWTQQVMDSLDAENIPYSICTKVSPNPRDFEVMEGSEQYLQAQCDILIAVGGGSVMDCAKGIGLVSTSRRSILDFEGIDQVEVPMPPLICIPTTGGTSADVSQFAIIRNSVELTKFAIISKAVVPDVALIDPATLTTLDPYLTACTAIDALVHAIEAFVSNAGSYFTDLHALEAVRLISQNLTACLAEPDNLELRTSIMLGSLQAGQAFSNASLGCVHSLAHGVGGLLDRPHGECNALLLPHVVDFNFAAAPERYLRIAETMGFELRGVPAEEARRRFIDALCDLRQSSGIMGTLGSHQLSACDVGPIAERAFNDPCTITNPRRPNVRDLATICEEAL